MATKKDSKISIALELPQHPIIWDANHSMHCVESVRANEFQRLADKMHLSGNCLLLCVTFVMML